MSGLTRRLRAAQLVDSELTLNMAASTRQLGLGPSKSAVMVQWLRVDNAGEADLGVRFGHALSWLDSDDAPMLTDGLDHSGHYDHDRDESALLCNASAVLSGR